MLIPTVSYPWDRLPAVDRLGIAVLAVLALAAGCGGNGDKGGSQASGTTAPTDAGVSLKGVCPDTIVVQTDWDPESEYGVSLPASMS